MSEAEGISYGLAARLRLAIADQAAHITDSAADLVPTCRDDGVSASVFVETAFHLAADGCELLALTIAYARQMRTSWDELGSTLGIDWQTAHERYASAVQQITDAIVLCWLLGDDPRFATLPEAATNPGEGAGRLDRWVRQRLTPAELKSRSCLQPGGCGLRPGDRSCTAPVSFNLPPLDIEEHYRFIAAGTQLVRDRLTEYGFPEARIRELTLKLARQRVALFERLLIEEAVEHDADGGEADGGEADRLSALLKQARAEVTKLELEASGD